MPGRRRDAAEHGANPGEQLVVEERPRDEIVGAAVEGAHAVDGVGLLRPEHDHRHVAVPRTSRLALAQPAADVELAAEQDEIRASSLGERQSVLAVLGPQHVEAVLGEVAREEAAGRRLGVGDQESAGHEPTVARRLRGPSRCPFAQLCDDP